MRFWIFISLFLLFLNASAQHVFRIYGKQKEDSLAVLCITKALTWSMSEDVQIQTMRIEQISGKFYFIVEMNLASQRRIAAVALNQELIGFSVDTLSSVAICTASNAYRCSFFSEHHRIIACKCLETGSISNHCHYKSIDAEKFKTMLQRAWIKFKPN